MTKYLDNVTTFVGLSILLMNACSMGECLLMVSVGGSGIRGKWFVDGGCP